MRKMIKYFINNWKRLFIVMVVVISIDYISTRISEPYSKLADNIYFGIKKYAEIMQTVKEVWDHR